MAVLALAAVRGLAQPSPDEGTGRPRLLESRKDIEFAPSTPYSWVSLDALNAGEIDPSVITDEEILGLVSDRNGRVATEEDCYEHRVTGCTPAIDGVPRESAIDYLDNPRGVISATVVDARAGFLYGSPYRLFELEIKWFTRNALPHVTSMATFLAAARDVTMAFGDTVICHRLPGTTEETLSIGSNVLYFPVEDPRPEGIEILHDLRHLIVEKPGGLLGAEPLIADLDLEGQAPFEQIEAYLRRRMGPVVTRDP